MTDVDALLEQRQVWTLPGFVEPTFYVGELTDEQLNHALVILNRNHGTLFDVAQSQRAARGAEHVALADRSGYDTLTWLHERPLYKRLRDEQRKRGFRE